MKLRILQPLAGLSLGALAFAFAIPNAKAQTNSWTNSATGYWQDATSWSLGLAPAPTQSLLITNAGNKTVLIDSSTSSGYSNTLTVSDLILAGQTGATNILQVSNIAANPPLHILNSLIINPGAGLAMFDAALLVDNAAGGVVDVEYSMGLSNTNFLSGGLYVGFATNATASVYVVDGQTTFTNGYMTVGFYGSAGLALFGGTLQTEDNVSARNGLFVGFGPASQGLLYVSGGTLLVPEHLSLGEDAGSTGQFTLNGGQLIATNNYLISIGGNGVAQVVVSNGQVAASSLIVGDAQGSSGTLTLVAGTVNLSGAMVVAEGQSSTGSVVISGGQLTVTNQSVSVGGFGDGQMTVSNGLFLAGSVIVGNCENSQGTFTIAGGAVSVASNMTAGARAYINLAPTSNANANATGTIDITGGSLTVTNKSGTGLLAIGSLGNGFFLQNGGLVDVDRVAIASGIASNVVHFVTNYVYTSVNFGQTTVSNGVLLAQSINVGVSSLGTLSIAGGAITASSNVTAAVTSNAVGVIQLSGGSLAVTSQFATAQLVVGQSGTATFLQSGGIATVDQLLVTNGASVFDLNSGTFNTKSTTVNNGQLFDVGDGADPATYHLVGGVHSFANGLEVRNNGILSGCGTINGSILVDPGGLVLADCGGTLTFTGSVTNNGAMEAANGSTVESYGSVVNNGTIDIISGNTNFHAGFVNDGTVLTSNSVPQIISITAVGSNIQVQFTTATNLNYVFEYTGNLLTGNWTPLVGINGPGGNVTVTDFNAILQTQRFYRVRLVVSP